MSRHALSRVVGLCFGLLGFVWSAAAEDGLEYVPQTNSSSSSSHTDFSRVAPKPPVIARPSRAEGIEYLPDGSHVDPEDPSRPLVSTGETVPELTALDNVFEKLVTVEQVPGAAVAVIRDRKLVYSRGFGYADLETLAPVQPNSLFRVASLSKSLTCTGILKLVDQQRLELDDRVFELLDIEPFLPNGGQIDERMHHITIEQCMHHTAGFDRDTTYDPAFRSRWIAEQLNISPPASSTDIIRYQMGRALDYDPGQKYRYSNHGYILLGRVIEKVSGRTYEEFMRDEVFAPLEMHDIRIGRELIEDRAEREVVYYTPKPWNASCAIPPRVGEMVPTQYGSWSLTAMDSAAGWLTTPIEMAKFAASFYGEDHPVLSRESVRTMFGPPPPPIGVNGDGQPTTAYYGCGWDVQQRPDGSFTAEHTGLFRPGSSALMVRRHDGIVYVVLCNQDATREKAFPFQWVRGRLNDAIDSVEQWPDRDFFATLESPTPVNDP